MRAFSVWASGGVPTKGTVAQLLSYRTTATHLVAAAVVDDDEATGVSLVAWLRKKTAARLVCRRKLLLIVFICDGPLSIWYNGILLFPILGASFLRLKRWTYCRNVVLHSQPVALTTRVRSPPACATTTTCWVFDRCQKERNSETATQGCCLFCNLLVQSTILST